MKLLQKPCFLLRLNLCEEKNIDIESIFAETMLLLAELHPNWRRWLRRCDTSLQVHLDAQASLTTTCWVSLSNFFTVLSCTITFTICRIEAFFLSFYDWHCSKFHRCTEFWSGIEEKGISDLQFSAWIVVTIKLLTRTNFPSLWQFEDEKMSPFFFLNMS